METIQALKVRTYGSGRRAVVLAHGFGLDQTIWQQYLPALWRYRVIVFDLAGCGQAERSYFDARRHGELMGHADDLLRLLTALSVERCTFVGHSVSGMVGVLAATRAPDQFEKLILIGTSPRYLDDEGYRGGFDQAGVAQMLQAIEANFREWAVAVTPITVSRPLDDPASQTFLHSLLQMEPDKALVMMKAILLSDYRDILHRCQVPAVVLQTKDDPAVPLEAALYLKDNIRAQAFEILQASGHQPQLSAPAVFVAALQRHLPKAVI
jgi:sigma-B regulation protein RsbQ